MIQTERRQQIVDLVYKQGSTTVSELCALFDVSDMTIRRDLRELDRDGLLRRVHGGAVSNLGRSYEPPFQTRSMHLVEAKQAIGRIAAQLIKDGDSLALDVGTTTLEIARNMGNRHNLTIITGSLPIANEICSSHSLTSSVRLILTGGIVRAGELSMTGDIAEETYRRLHVDKAFIGVGGVSLESGLTEYNLEDAVVKRALIRYAQQRIVVADGSKLGRTAFASVAPLSMVDILVTDPNAPPEIVAALESMDIDVILAPL
jgi:DeoR/GlpR family transcriptional regulator of sugar metabolism